MAGYSRWANIRRRESAQALRRDKRLARAAPQGGETVRYEGYGPGGAAVMVECVTDDRRQVGAKVRRAFVQHGGRLGAEDVVPNADHSVEVLADPLEFDTVCAVLTHHGFAPATAEVTQRAATSLELSGETAVLMVHLLEALEELDEVRDVYSNVEISDEVLARV